MVCPCLCLKITRVTCNLSMMTGIFPTGLSLGKVRCSYKNGDITNLSNYIPIALLPSFGKILEKKFESQLVKYFEPIFC